MKDLAVFLDGRRAGTIRQASGLRFTYDDAYRADEAATPLSLSMPLSEREHTNRVTLSWVNGLLPADREVRARIAERGGVRATNPAALLTVIGLDCPGAVQVAPIDRADEVRRPSELVEVDADWIRGRLAHLRRDEAAWQIADERWSIGGGQSNQPSWWNASTACNERAAPSASTPRTSVRRWGTRPPTSAMGGPRRARSSSSCGIRHRARPSASPRRLGPGSTPCPRRDPARRAGVHLHHRGEPARRGRAPAPLRRRRRPVLPPRAGPVGPSGPLGLNPCWIRARCTRSRTTSGTASRAAGPS